MTLAKEEGMATNGFPYISEGGESEEPRENPIEQMNDKREGDERCEMGQQICVLK